VDRIDGAPGVFWLVATITFVEAGKIRPKQKKEKRTFFSIVL
jgi:hypothetical protein